MPLLIRISLIVYILTSALAFVIYGLDKRAAIRGRRRVPEKALHLLALLGGFTGALIAQQVFRHKRRKLSFVMVTWLIVLLHATVWFIVIRSR